MVKKSEKIEVIMKELEAYCKKQDFPWLPQLLGIKENYDVSHIVGMIEQYIKPVYEEGCLTEYLKMELAKYKMLQTIMCEDLPEVELTDEQLKYIERKLVEIIKIITF